MGLGLLPLGMALWSFPHGGLERKVERSARCPLNAKWKLDAFKLLFQLAFIGHQALLSTYLFIDLTRAPCAGRRKKLNRQRYRKSGIGPVMLQFSRAYFNELGWTPHLIKTSKAEHQEKNMYMNTSKKQKKKKG